VLNYTAGTSLTLSGASNAISGSASNNYGPITISGGADYTAGNAFATGAMTLTGSFSNGGFAIATGAMTAGGSSTLTLAGSTITVTGGLSSSGTVTNAGTLQLSGGTWQGSASFGKTIVTGGTVTLGSTVICGPVTVNNTFGLTLSGN